MEDHFSINVARRVKEDSEPFGPYHQHYVRVTMPSGRTKREAIEVYDDFCKKYPEPEWRVSLSENVYRGVHVRDSGGKPQGKKP